MRLIGTIVVVAALVAAGVAMVAMRGGAAPARGKRSMRTVYEFQAKSIDGAERSLSEYKGKTLLIVNTASKCGFTPQYRSLEDLYEKYHARGFEVLAFPANNFMNQEPGTNPEILQFCTKKFGTTFPLFSKISVRGKGIDPLYRYLTREAGFDGEIEWNFTKFLVDPQGKVVARFRPGTDPLSAEITAKLEPLLPLPASDSAKAM